MSRKLYVFDVGNTLVVKPNNTMDQDTVMTLCSLHDKGYIIGIASMRNKAQYDFIKKDVPFDFFIGLNGTYVELEDKTIIEQPLSEKEFKRIYSFIAKNEISGIFHTREQLIPCDEKVNEPVFVVELFDVSSRLHNLMNFLGEDFTYHIWERGKSCDIYSKMASKRIALQVICECYDLCRQNCIAFGDGFNDVDLFKFCGKTVAMETAPDALKKISTYITKSAKQQGVVWALNNLDL